MEFVKKYIVFFFYIFCAIALVFFGYKALNLGDKFFLTENEVSIFLDSKYQIEIDNVGKIEKKLHKYEYISQNEDIATVDSNGLVTPKKYGTAIIVVKNGSYKEEIKIKVTEEVVALLGDYVSIGLGETYDINNMIKKRDNNIEYQYESTNTLVADIDEYGILRGKTIGDTTIYVYTNKDKKSSVKVHVGAKIIEVESITFNVDSISLYIGTSVTLNATVSPSNATDKTIKWESNNDTVMVDKTGKITALKKGSAIITATASNGISSECMVNVSERPTTTTKKVTTTVKPTTKATTKATTTTTTKKKTTTTTKVQPKPTTSKVVKTTVTLNKTSVTLNVGASIQLIATVTPFDNRVTWSSSDSSVASVSAGLVTAKKAGTCTITITTHDGVKASAKLTVNNKVIAAKRIDVSDTSFSMSVGDTKTLTASVYPTNATDSQLKWTSSDPSVATVSNGVVKGVKAGTCKIVVKNGSNISSTIDVTVKAKVIVPASVTLNKTTATLASTKTLTLKATITPSNVDNKKIVWSSSDTSIATVSNGVVTAKKAGTVKISAKTHNNKSAVLTLTVRPLDLILIGNSKTYRNPNSYPSVYNVFVSMMKEKYSANITRAAVGGTSLVEKARGKCVSTCSSTEKNNSLASAKSAITKKKYDIAVLQEATGYAASNDYYETGVKELKNLLVAKNKNITIYLRQSWHFKEKVSKQSYLNNNASNLAKNYSLKIIKDGTAFYKYYKKYGNYKLYADNTHGSDEGVYLASLCIYKTLTGEKASSVKYRGKVSDSRAKILQTIADNSCK